MKCNVRKVIIGLLCFTFTNSEYVRDRDRITLAVLELREKGDLQKLHKKWWYGKGECGTEKSGKKVH